MPWLLYLTARLGALPDPLAPKYLWEALWPVLIGGVLAIMLARWGEQRLPKIPEGDIAVAIDAAARAAISGSGRLERIDNVLRRWPVAGVALLLVAIALGAAIVAGR